MSLSTSAPPGCSSSGSADLDRREQRLLVRAVGRAHARELGRRVREQHVGRTARRFENRFANRGLREIPDQRDRVRKLERRLDRGEVHAHHAARGPDLARGHLQPAARPAAEIDHALAAPQHLRAALDLEQLVRRARAVALALGALVEGVLALVGAGHSVVHLMAFARLRLAARAAARR